jgi:hypothetical protein
MLLRFLTSVLLLPVLPLLAQAPKEARPSTISGARLRSILQGMALDFTEDSSAEPATFTIHLAGHAISVLNRATGLKFSTCLDQSAGASRSGKLPPGVSPEDLPPGITPADLNTALKANQWNREHFSTSIYLDERRNNCLRAEVSYGGGATDTEIRNFVHGFCTGVAVFTRFLAAPQDHPGSPIGPMAWSQLGPFAKPATPSAPPAASLPGLLQIQANVSLQYDPRQWKPASSPSPGRFALTHTSGAAHVLIISERTAVPIDAVQDVVLQNAQSFDPHAAIAFRNRPWVKGVVSLHLKMEATAGDVPMIYWTRAYTGEAGTVQVAAYTEKARLPSFEQPIADLLNGLTIKQ